MSRCCECRRCERAPDEASGLGWLWTRIVEPALGGMMASTIALYLLDVEPETAASWIIGCTAFAALCGILPDPPRRTD